MGERRGSAGIPTLNVSLFVTVITDYAKYVRHYLVRHVGYLHITFVQLLAEILYVTYVFRSASRYDRVSLYEFFYVFVRNVHQHMVEVNGASSRD